MVRRYASALGALLITTATVFGQGGVIPTEGKEFWLGFMQNYDGSVDLHLYISARVNTTGTVVQPLAGWSTTFTVTANTVTQVDVPVAAMVNGSETVSNQGILVQTADTVSVFSLNHNSATTDAAVIYPTKSLGTTYRAQCYVGLSGFGTLNSELMVVATKDGTQVDITPTVSTLGGQPAGIPFTVNLDSGQVYQVQAANSNDDLTGTLIEGTALSGSCRPFAVFSGSVCPDIPTGCYACDHVYDENLPTNVWGTTYYAVPWSGTTAYAYRILASQNGTSVTANGGAPVNLNAGQWFEVDGANTPICFQGNVPFNVAQFMEGNSCSGGNSDPALVVLNAEQQKINDISFAALQYPAFTEQYANVIVETASSNSVLLDGVPVPAASFTAFPFCGTQSYAQLPLTQGSHRLACATGLTAYVYGLGPNYETYVYSVGSFSPLPPIQIDTVLCGVDSTGQLTLAPPDPVNNPFWYVVSNPLDTLHFGLSYTFTPPASDVYVVTGYQFLSSCEQQYFFSVEVSQPPALTITANGVPGPAVIQVCAYEAVQLDVIPSPGGTYNYNWWPDVEITNGSIHNPVAHPSHSGWFYASVATLNNCSVAFDSIYVDVIGGDVIVYDATTPDNAICLGDTTALNLNVQQIIQSDTLTDNFGNMWGAVDNGVVANTCGSVTGNAIYFDGNGLREISTIGLDVSLGGSLQFAIKMGTGLAPCEDVDPGEDVVIDYSLDGGGTWAPPFFTCWEYLYPTFTTVNVPIPAAAQSINTIFRWRQLANSGAGQDNWSLDNITVETNDISGLTFEWTPYTSTNPFGQNTLAYPSTTGWYYVNTTDVNTTCTYEDSLFITVGAPFSIDVTNDTTICDVAGIQLHATPSSGTNHVWNWTPSTFLNASFVEDPLATPTTTTEYHVTVTSAEGCERTDSVTITVGQLLSLVVATSDNQLCQGQTANLTATVPGFPPNLSYSWTPSNWVSNANIWNPIASPSGTAWYVCTVTDTLSGCVLRDSVLINCSTQYNVFAGNDTVVCSINGYHLNVTHNVPNPIISWTPAAQLNGANTATPLVIYNSSSTYIVQVSDNLGCSDRDTVLITVAFDQLTFFSDTSLCAGDSAYIDAGYPSATHIWTPGGETTQGIWVNSPNNYTVNMVDTNQCPSTFTTTVTVDPLPIVQLGPDTSLCIGQVWLLDAGTASAQHLWNTSATTQAINVTTNDDYWVRVTDQNHCVNSDTILVTFDPLPVVDLHDTTVCVSEVITLDAGNPGAYYHWNTNATTQTINVNATSGTYSVVVTTPTICVDSSSATLTFIPFPVVNLGPDQALCDLDTLVLDANNPGQSFLWMTGETTQTITLYDDADVWVDVYNGYCTTRDSMHAAFNPRPLYPLDSMTVVCLNYPPYKELLDAQNPGCTYVWNTDESTQTIEVDTYGWYIVTITTPLNCSITDSTHVVEYCGSELFIPNSFTPDGDGINDMFEPTGWNLGKKSLMIFDRWGEPIFKGDGNAAKWDGTLGGTQVQDGVYVWKFKYRFIDDVSGTLGAEREAVGHVTVLR